MVIDCWVKHKQREEECEKYSIVKSPVAQEFSVSALTALSEWESTPLNEAIYEELEYKLAREGTYSAPRWGSSFSDDLPSGYDDVADADELPSKVRGKR
ncbi:hypothetical protein GJAV_G00146250 [Gymnothorax javanicus]|nr:hypothetical protein GJAV_G00146250 [Gymnothorax javanicus]